MPPAASVEAWEHPKRAPGVDLLGATDTGSRGDRWLICVDGSRYVQATPRLYLVLRYSDGLTALEEIARKVSQDLGQEMTAAQVKWLLRNRLVPAGLISAGSTAGEDGSDQRGKVESRSPLLAIKHRLPILPYRVTAPVASLLQRLFWPPLGFAFVAGAAAVVVWTCLGPGLGLGIRVLISQPELVLVLLVLDVPLRIFHELGHASAMRRAGVPFGEIGVALYVIVPVYYTDVTHSYRLGRADRLRVDVGGMYFDCMSIIGLFVAFQLTGQAVLVLAIVLIGLNMLREFTPFMRFDGYYLLADLVGVHDPLSVLGPFVRDHLPGRRGPRTLSGLNRVQRITLGAYFIVALAFLLRPLLLLVLAGPAVVGLFAQQGLTLQHELTAAWQMGDAAKLIAAGAKLLFLLLVPLGLALFSASLLRVVWRMVSKAAPKVRLRRTEPLVVDAAGLDGPPGRTVVAAEPDAGMQQRIHDAQRERDALSHKLDRLEAVFNQHLAELRELGEALAGPADRAQRCWEAASEEVTSTAVKPAGERVSGG